MADTCISCGKELPEIKRYTRKTGLCASCNARSSISEATRIRIARRGRPPFTRQEKLDKKRLRYLPEQLAATRKKLEMLTREAIRLGMEISHE